MNSGRYHKGRRPAPHASLDVRCWHEREVFQCQLCRRSWSISGRNADIAESTRLTHHYDTAVEARLSKIGPLTATVIKRFLRRLIKWEGGRHRRRSDHETFFCASIGGDLRRRFYSQLCPWRWTWRRPSRRVHSKSYDTPWIASTADARFRKPDSGPACGTYTATGYQWAAGTESIRWRYVGTATEC